MKPYKTHNMSLEEIRREGMKVLAEKLGIVGMIRFLQQTDKGWGDYTTNRKRWLKDVPVEEIFEEIKSLRK